MDWVKCFFKINEVYYYWFLELYALINNVPQTEYLFHPRSSISEACLLFSLCNITTDLSLLSNIVDKIFPRIDNKQIPLQLLQFVRLPFFGNLTIMPLLHSSGMVYDEWMYRQSQICRKLLLAWVFKKKSHYDGCKIILNVAINHD